MATAGGSGVGAGRAGRRVAAATPPAPAGGAAASVGRMLRVSTVCRLLDRERKWVLEHCRRGTWPGTRMVGNAWRVPEASLARWMALAGAPGTD